MIKNITESNLAECAEVIQKAFLTVANHFGFTQENAPFFTAFATTTERLEYQLFTENRLMFAYFDNDKIVGYYSLLFLDNNECELNNLCVLPDYRHKKIGEQLLQNAFTVAKENNCKKIKISIVEENEVVKKWYASFGFIHTNKEKLDFFPFTCGYMEKLL